MSRKPDDVYVYIMLGIGVGSIRVFRVGAAGWHCGWVGRTAAGGSLDSRLGRVWFVLVSC